MANQARIIHSNIKKSGKIFVKPIFLESELDNEKSENKYQLFKNNKDSFIYLLPINLWVKMYQADREKRNQHYYQVSKQRARGKLKEDNSNRVLKQPWRSFGNVYRFIKERWMAFASIIVMVGWGWLMYIWVITWLD